MLRKSVVVDAFVDEPGRPDYAILSRLPDPATACVAVMGLGYVGLPLVLGFSRGSEAIGFDINTTLLADLSEGRDNTGEVTTEELAEGNVTYTDDPERLSNADVIIVCVPTPINARNEPDYGPLYAASRMIGHHMKAGTVVVFESTVDPGTTEGPCLRAIEEESGLKEGHDFYIGYSPERINPADRQHKLHNTKKVVAGSTPEVTRFLADLYGRVIEAGLYEATSIRVAEAAKILENTQRDLNIALMNEMMVLFDKMGIRSTEVIAAASSKWNFHPYRPGLVGGHCISVDPYYLVAAGRRLGLDMGLVAQGRAVNEATPHFFAEKLERLFNRRNQTLQGKRILVLGRTFKEDCPDVRNSKAVPMMDAMWLQGADVFCYDPIALEPPHHGGRGITMINHPGAEGPYHGIVLTLGHRIFRDELTNDQLKSYAPPGAPMIDMRGLFDNEEMNGHFTYWRP